MGNLCSDDRSRPGQPWNTTIEGVVRSTISVYEVCAKKVVDGPDSEKMFITRNTTTCDAHRADWREEVSDKIESVMDAAIADSDATFDEKEASKHALVTLNAMKYLGGLVCDTLLKDYYQRINSTASPDQMIIKVKAEMDAHFQKGQQTLPLHIPTIFKSVDDTGKGVITANQLRVNFLPSVINYAKTLTLRSPKTPATPSTPAVPTTPATPVTPSQ